jgi:beta-lactamase class A
MIRKASSEMPVWAQMLFLVVAALLSASLLLGIGGRAVAQNEEARRSGVETAAGGAYAPTREGQLRLALCLHVDGHISRQIEWAFYIFETPDFSAEPLARLSAQTVDILQASDDGWMLVQTRDGAHWAHSHPDQQRIDRRMGLFLDRADPTPYDFLPPQVVRVLERDENWLQIETQEGPMWLTLDFAPPTYALEEALRRHGGDMAVYFENVETGFVFRHDADRVFFSASVPKAVYALYLFHLAEQGLVCLDSELTYTWADFMGGSGIIRYEYAVGATFTLRELLRLNVSESDNIATLILRRAHGIDGFRRFLAEMGANPHGVGGNIMDSFLSAEEAGLFAREIFRYIESGGRYSEALRADLLDNQFPFIVSDYPVASKTGWTSFLAWHDMAIVYAPSPYILVILTERYGWTEADFRDFEEISMAFQAFNSWWFGFGGEADYAPRTCLSM